MNKIIRDFINITIFLTVLLSFGQVGAEDKTEQVTQQEIPDYFLAPEGPFKDKEAYEKALKEQKTYLMPFFDLPKIRTEQLYDLCKIDLQQAGADNQKFMVTHCGMLMQGLIEGVFLGYYNNIQMFGSKMVEIKPFCITEENPDLITLAKAFTEFLEKFPKKIHEETMGALTKSIAHKFPCPWLIEMKNK